ncbi:MAG: AEC family transporter, partial [Pseudomonadota bacterium]
PLAVGHFGDEAIAPLAVVVAVHAPAMWIVATFQQEAAARDTGRTLGVMVRDVGVMLVRNPILIGIIGGTLWRTTGVAIPTIPLTIIDYLAAAGIPGALFALGLSLVRYRITGQTATLIAMSLLKLLVMPAVAWLAGVYIFDLPALWLGVAVILAACPTGANAYLFAARYERAVGSVSGSVALTTLLSLVTITALLSVLPK